MYLALDIETVRNERADDFFNLGYARPDRRYKDPDKIKASLDEQYRKCGLRWWLAQVCCITARLIGPEEKQFSESNKNEKQLLTNFADFLESLNVNYQPIGKNSKNFDFPMLIGRYLFHDIGVPRSLIRKERICDVDEIFAPYSRNDQTTSLKNYAWGLGLQGKLDGQDGSTVQEWYDNDDLSTMENYCMRDTEIVSEILNRFRIYRKEQPNDFMNIRQGIEL